MRFSREKACHRKIVREDVIQPPGQVHWFEFEYRSTRLVGRCFFELRLLGAAAGNYEFYGTISNGGGAGSFELYGALLLGAAAVLLALFSQGQGDRGQKFQCAMVLLLSRHGGQSQGAAEPRREDPRYRHASFTMDTAFLDTSLKVDLSPYFSKVGLDSSNSGIRQRFNVDRSCYPPVTSGGKVGVLGSRTFVGGGWQRSPLHTFT